MPPWMVNCNFIWRLFLNNAIVVINMQNSNGLYEDMRKLNLLYEELCWDYDDELMFTHDGKKIIIFNKTQSENDT